MWAVRGRRPLRRDRRLREPVRRPVPVSEQSGVPIVMGSGFYCEYACDPWVLTATIDHLMQRIVGDLTQGIDGIRSGIIGEIGINGQERGTLKYVGEMTTMEERSLRAACRASVETGAPLSIHQPNRASAVPAILSILKSENVPPEKVILCHMSSIWDFSMHLYALERGYRIGYDNFGMMMKNPIDTSIIHLFKKPFSALVWHQLILSPIFNQHHGFRVVMIITIFARFKKIIIYFLFVLCKNIR